MKLFDLDPNQRWLFVFAHPDDELAIAAWMKKLTSAQVPIFVVWMHTLGLRGEEARKAARTIGVSKENCFEFQFEDGIMHTNIPAIEKSLSLIIEQVQPTRIVCAAYEQGHLDHDAIRYALSKTWDGSTAEFPEYWPYTPRVAAMNRFSDEANQEIYSLDKDEQEWKVSLARSYPTTAIWKNLCWYEVWTAVRGKRAHLKRTERLRWSPEHNYFEPNVPEKYRQKVIRSKGWRSWIDALQNRAED